MKIGDRFMLDIIFLTSFLTFSVVYNGQIPNVYWFAVVALFVYRLFVKE